MNSGYKKKSRGPDAVQQPPVVDRFRRCDKCFASHGLPDQPDVHTLMVTEIVRLKVIDGPNLDIAKAIRCGNSSCDNIHDVQLFRAARERGINQATIFLLMRASRGVATFTLEELKSGKIEKVPLPESIEKMLAQHSERTRPVFGQEYDPNAYIEPRGQENAQELPL